jgi:hypothetical protein
MKYKMIIMDVDLFLTFFVISFLLTISIFALKFTVNLVDQIVVVTQKVEDIYNLKNREGEILYSIQNKNPKYLAKCIGLKCNHAPATFIYVNFSYKPASVVYFCDEHSIHLLKRIKISEDDVPSFL